MANGALLVYFCVPVCMIKRVSECLEHGRHSILIFWNKWPVCSADSVLTDCLTWVLQYLCRSHPLSLVLTVWPDGWVCHYFSLWLCGQIGPATFRCSTNLELFKQPHMCVSDFLSDSASLPVFQIIRLLFYLSDTPESWLTLYMAPCVGPKCTWLILGSVCLSGYMSSCESDGTVFSCPCVLSCIPLTVSDWESDNQYGYFCQSHCAIYHCNHLNNFS